MGSWVGLILHHRVTSFFVRWVIVRLRVTSFFKEWSPPCFFVGPASIKNARDFVGFRKWHWRRCWIRLDARATN